MSESRLDFHLFIRLYFYSCCITKKKNNHIANQKPAINPRNRAYFRKSDLGMWRVEVLSSCYRCPLTETA